MTQFISKLIDEFRLIRPGIPLEVQSLEWLPNDIQLMADPALRMAILNVLNNAADASPQRVMFEARFQAGHLILDITDFGNGLDSSGVFSLQTSSKQNGLGMGLFLSHATVNRYGGSIQLFQPATLVNPKDLGDQKISVNQEPAGTVVRIDLPL